MIKKLLVIIFALQFLGVCYASEVAYFKVKKTQKVSKWRYSLMTDKKDPGELDIVPNAKSCYTFPNGGDIISVLINGHGVKKLHKKFYGFEAIEDPTPEEQAKMDKFREVRAKHPSTFDMSFSQMEEIGIKADFLGYTEAGVYLVFPDLDGWKQSGVTEDGDPIMVRIFKPANWAM